MIAALILSTAVWLPSSPGEGSAAPPDFDASSAYVSAQDAAAKPKSDGNRLVKVALFADRAAIRPGETCTLAVKLAIEPGWHIYWQNPGDAGVPTKAEVRAPEGFVVGAVRYPPPHREESAGEIVSYVYTGEAALLVDVTAPKNLTPGTKVEIGVACRWLVCTSVCLQGSGQASVELASVAASEPQRPANEKEFSAWRERMPKAYDELLAIQGFHASEFTDWKKPFVVTVPGALELDFYPYVEDPNTLDVGSLQLQAEGTGFTMKIRFEPPDGYEGPRFGFKGLVVVRRERGETFYDMGIGYGAPVRESGGAAAGKSPPKRDS